MKYKAIKVLKTNTSIALKTPPYFTIFAPQIQTSCLSKYTQKRAIRAKHPFGAEQEFQNIISESNLMER